MRHTHNDSTTNTDNFSAVPIVPQTGEAGHPLHRLAAARRAKHVSRAAISERLHTSTSEIVQQEQEMTDLPLSTLYRWAAALHVPASQLLVEPEAVFLRDSDWARAAQWMAIGKAILSRTERPAVKRLSQTLLNQLAEMMPALEEMSRGSPDKPPRLPDGDRPAMPAGLPEAMFVPPSAERSSTVRPEIADRARRAKRRGDKCDPTDHDECDDD